MLLLAIVTDVIGMLIVAPRHLVIEVRAGGAAHMVVALLAAAILRRFRVRAFWPFLLLCGAISWVAFYWEGLHPAFALIPIVPFLPHEPRRHLDVFADTPDDDAVHHSEHEWHLVVQPVVFLFGLVNAGVMLRGYDNGSFAMLAAQIVGRPVGIIAAVSLAVAAGLHLPGRMGWRELLVVAFATSSGFAIALFRIKALATGVSACQSVRDKAGAGVARGARLLVGRLARTLPGDEVTRGFRLKTIRQSERSARIVAQLTRVDELTKIGDPERSRPTTREGAEDPRYPAGPGRCRPGASRRSAPGAWRAVGACGRRPGVINQPLLPVSHADAGKTPRRSGRSRAEPTYRPEASAEHVREAQDAAAKRKHDWRRARGDQRFRPACGERGGRGK